MSDLALLLLLYGVAVVLLVAEIFIPSHGVLTIAGLGFLIGAIAKTFQFGTAAGAVAIVASVVLLPLFAVIAVKVWPHTRIGRLIAPPNPVYTPKDLGTDVAELEALVGSYGQSLSPLRPVGTCEFNGHRLPCVAQTGLLDAGVKVVAVGLRGRSLEVIAADEYDQASV